MLLPENPKKSKIISGRLVQSPFFSSLKTLSSSYSFPSSHTTPSTPCHTVSEAMMEENIENAELIISKWDPNSPSYVKATSLFHHDRKEAKDFLKSVKDLRRAMHFLVSENSTSEKLILAQNLMQKAMKRLEKEFHRILSENCDHLHPESVSSQSSSGSSNFDCEEEILSDEFEFAGEAITEVERVSALALTDLKSIADCMIMSGYGKECAKVYIIIRKAVVDEGLCHLGIEKFRSSQIQKINTEDLGHVVMRWITATKIAVRRLYSGEKVLCDHVFSASKKIRELCFSEITKEGAINLFRFPELISKISHSLDRTFQLMDLFEAVSELRPEIELIFDSESTSAIRLQALTYLKLGDPLRAMLSEFETTIRKDSSRTVAFGGGIHPLTQSAMGYICSLADYEAILSCIIVDNRWPATPSLPDSYFESPTTDDGPTAAVSVYLAGLILVLLCKLDRKAELYKDVSLTYLFLANNLHFIVEKVRTTNLKHLLGNDWLMKHAKKVRKYATSYETMAWTKVFSSLPRQTSPAITPEMAKECFTRFNAAFEELYTKQRSWVVPDGKLRDGLKTSIAKKLVPVYREFYDMALGLLIGQKNLVLLLKYSPDDLGNYLSDLFSGASALGSPTSRSSSSLKLGVCLPR